MSNSAFFFFVASARFSLFLLAAKYIFLKTNHNLTGEQQIYPFCFSLMRKRFTLDPFLSCGLFLAAAGSNAPPRPLIFVTEVDHTSVHTLPPQELARQISLAGMFIRTHTHTLPFRWGQWLNNGNMIIIYVYTHTCTRTRAHIYTCERNRPHVVAHIKLFVCLREAHHLI